MTIAGSSLITLGARSDKARISAQDAHVRSVTRICREHVRIEFEHGAFPPSVPGQFLQVRCAGEARESVCSDEPPAGDPLERSGEGYTPFLRRPFSIADRVDRKEGRSTLTIISRAVGIGTRWLDRLSPGDMLNITGPLGRGFRLPASPTASVILVGGGVGIPPLLYALRVAAFRSYAEVTAIFGATSADLIPIRITTPPAVDGTPTSCLDAPGAAGSKVIVTTDDGSAGLRGRVTVGLDAWAARREDAGIREATVLACGPEPMLEAVARWTRERGIACQLCIERMMGCGFGTCLSCVVRVVDRARPTGWRWALTCCEGPVFDRDQLWHDMGGSA